MTQHHTSIKNVGNMYYIYVNMFRWKFEGISGALTRMKPHPMHNICCMFNLHPGVVSWTFPCIVFLFGNTITDKTFSPEIHMYGPGIECPLRRIVLGLILLSWKNIKNFTMNVSSLFTLTPILIPSMQSCELL